MKTETNTAVIVLRKYKTPAEISVPSAVNVTVCITVKVMSFLPERISAEEDIL